MDAATWESLRHPSFPPPGSPSVDYASFLLEHAHDALLMHGVAEIPFLSDQGCALLAAHTARIIGEGGDGVGSMHGYGTDLINRCPTLLSDIGAQLEPLFQLLFLDGIAPTSSPPTGAPLNSLALYSAHAIMYGMGGTRERALKLHVDDSLVTATLCLRSKELQGTDLVFHGAKRLAWPTIAAHQARLAATHAAHGVNVEEGVHEMRRQPQLGRALLHLGKHPHRTIPIAGGERVSWVLWWHKKGAAPPTVAAVAQ